MVERVHIDEETGEVLDEPGVTISAGGQEVSFGSVTEFSEASRRVREGLTQLRLFEGHKVDLIQLQIKAMKGAARSLTPDVEANLPKMRERRYFIIEADVAAVEHTDAEDVGGEKILTRVIKFQPVRTSEITKFEAERVLDRR